MEFVEQRPSTVWIKWGELKADDDPAHKYSVPVDSTLIVEIKNIDESTVDEGKYVVRAEILNNKGEKTGKIVAFTPPGALQGRMGLNPNFPMDHVANPGDIMSLSASQMRY